MPRACRVVTRTTSAADGFTALNTISTISSFLLGLSILPFLYNVWKTAKYGKKIEVDDPWGYGRSLEWATSCPPPRHNFLTLPRIRSESPAFDLHHPEIAALDQLENHGDVHGDNDARRWQGGREVKIQGKMFLWLSAFILVMAVVYGVWSKEAAGTTALVHGLRPERHDRLLPGLHGPAGRRGRPGQQGGRRRGRRR